MTLTAEQLETLRRLLDHQSDEFVELAHIAGLRLDKDFRHANLRGVDFGTVDTTGWDFTGSDLSYADLSHTKGTPPKATGARIDDTKLPAAGLRHVFVSYVRENRDVVDRLVASLRARGITIWLDRDSISPGVRWRDALTKAIRSSAFYISCFSREYNGRDRSYMNEELTIALDELRARPSERTWFIPVLIDNSPIPSRSITATESLSDIQFVNLYEDWDQGIGQIMRVLDPFAASVPALVGALKDHDVDARASAADALGRIGRSASEAVPALIAALNDDDARVRRNAAGALAKINGDFGS